MPFLAYHDTMFPGKQIDPPRRSFLLFAPRERCYGHALDDNNCPRNRHYLQALQEWTGTFREFDDNHTFEYYFDQILFRGMYPFVPSVIIDDARVYESHAIECHMSLQVAGPAIAPEYNMILFSRTAWEAGLTAEQFYDELDVKMGATGAWRDYLRRRADVFADALRFCYHDLDVYLDYRWLP